MVQISELSSLIHYKCDTSQAQSLYLHKETNAPYVVTSYLEYYAGSFYESGHNIAELTKQDLDEILHSVYELDIQTAIKTQYFTIHERLAWKSFEFKICNSKTFKPLNYFFAIFSWHTSSTNISLYISKKNWYTH